MPSTIYNQKSHFLFVVSGTATTYSPSNTKFSLKFDLTTGSSNEKQSILIKFKICVSQLIAKILKQWRLNQIRHCLTAYIQSNVTFFYKKLKYFNDFQNMKFLSFITKLNPKNGSETKPDIYSKDIFKSDTIFFLSKKIKVFQWLQKSKFFNFLTKLKAKNENEAKSDIFP